MVRGGRLLYLYSSTCAINYGCLYFLRTLHDVPKTRYEFLELIPTIFLVYGVFTTFDIILYKKKSSRSIWYWKILFIIRHNYNISRDVVYLGPSSVRLGTLKPWYVGGGCEECDKVARKVTRRVLRWGLCHAVDGGQNRICKDYGSRQLIWREKCWETWVKNW